MLPFQLERQLFFQREMQPDGPRGSGAIVVVFFCLLILLLPSCGTGRLPPCVTDNMATGEKVVRLKHLERASVPEVYVLSGRENTPLRMVLVCETQGYNGLIRLCATLDLQEQKIVAVNILEHQESANYGAYAAENWFRRRFAGKSVAKDLQVVKMA
ncbi:MAG TPA: hypothetical protein GX699_02900, partial [Firmicutes bacterium]|nr:hypothetical protein [Bacillota bacterium]